MAAHASRSTVGHLESVVRVYGALLTYSSFCLLAVLHSRSTEKGFAGRYEPEHSVVEAKSGALVKVIITSGPYVAV